MIFFDVLLSLSGVVGQEPVLFHGTISENISITAPEATQEEIQRVAEIAYAHDFIMKLPDVRYRIPVS